MRRLVHVILLGMVVNLSATAMPAPASAELKMVLGGRLSSGIALVAGDGYEDWNNLDRDDRTAKHSIGGNAYIDIFFHELVALEAGIGFLNKGIRFSEGDYRLKESLVFMEIPVMAKLDYKHFQAAVGLSFNVALSGRTIIKEGDDELTRKYNRNRWNYVHRVNLGPMIVLGYAIPVGPVFIVPGMSWTMHFINDLNAKEIEDDFRGVNSPRARAVNLMFNVGVEWAIPY